jgi:hypothetical protein
MDITRGTHAAPDDFTVNSRAVPRDPSIPAQHATGERTPTSGPYDPLPASFGSTTPED